MCYLTQENMLLLHLASVCSPGVKRASSLEGTSEPVPLEMETSRLLQGLLHEVTAGQPVRKILVEDLPFKNSATASGCVCASDLQRYYFSLLRKSKFSYSHVLFHSRVPQRMSPKTINYLVKAGFLSHPENFPCQKLEGET